MRFCVSIRGELPCRARSQRKSVFAHDAGAQSSLDARFVRMSLRARLRAHANGAVHCRCVLPTRLHARAMMKCEQL